jgi:hypothetical protein
VKPTDMGDNCLLQLFNSNYTFITLYLIHEMDIEYLIVDEIIYISKLFNYTCMFSIGANL